MSDSEAVARYVTSTQADGRLLLRFVARRADRTLPPAPEEDPVADAVLFEPAEQVAASPPRVAALMAAIDRLSQRAAPANVRSIRLTATYLGIAAEDGEPPREIKAECWWIRLYMAIVIGLAVVLLLAGVGLLAHMDAGRRLLLQLKELRQVESELQKDISTVPEQQGIPLGVLVHTEPGTEGRPTKLSVVRLTPPLVTRIADQFGKTEAEVKAWQAAAPLCGRPLYMDGGAGGRFDVTMLAEPPAALGDFVLALWREPGSQNAAAVCRRHDDLRVRMALLYTGFADWNCRSNQVFQVLAVPYRLVQMIFRVPRAEGMGVPCGAPSVPLPPEVSRDAWRSHETAVTITSSVVAGFLLPLLLGSLGGCAYGMRRIDQKLSGWTLEPQDGRHALVRVALAAVLGGLLGVVWTSGEPVSLGGFSLSLAAAAFFIGFSVEPVFKMIEAVVIDFVLNKISPPKK